MLNNYYTDKMKNIKVLILLSWGVLSCSSAEEKVYLKLNEEVMKMHDQLMPKTESLVELENKLTAFEKGADSTHVKKLKIALRKTDESMMDWMHGYSLDSLEKMDIPSKIIYLNQKLMGIKEIKEKTDSTIKAVEEYVKKK